MTRFGIKTEDFAWQRSLVKNGDGGIPWTKSGELWATDVDKRSEDRLREDLELVYEGERAQGGNRSGWRPALLSDTAEDSRGSSSMPRRGRRRGLVAAQPRCVQATW
jgi:hypothetical protein